MYFAAKHSKAAHVSVLCVWLLVFMFLRFALGSLDITYSLNTILAKDPTTGRNFTKFQAQVVSFPATDANPGSNDVQIGDLHWDIEAQPPLLVNTVQLAGFVPAGLTVGGWAVTLVDQTARFQGPQAVGNLTSGDFFNSRRLLALEMQRQPVTLYRPHKLMFNFGRILDDASHYAGLNFICAGFDTWCGDSGGGPTAAEIEMQKKLDAFQANVTKQLGFINDQFGAVNKQLSQQNEAIFTVEEQIQAQQTQSSALNNSIYALAAKQDADNAATQQAFTTVYDNLANAVTIASASTDAQLRSYAVYMQTQLQGVINATNAVRNSLLAARRQLLARSRDNTRLLKKLAGGIINMRTERPLGRQMAKGIWQQMDYLSSLGYTPFLDPTAMGKRPASHIPADIQVVSVSNGPQCVSFVNNTGGHLVAHQICYNFQCQVTAVLANANSITGATYEDFMEFTGPVGCGGVNGTKAASKCNCWFTVTHKSCRPEFLSGGNTFTFTTIPRNSSNTAFTLNPSMCASSVQPTSDVWDGRVIDNINVFHTMIGGICSSQVLDDNFPVPSFVLIGSGATVWIKSNPSDSACKMEMDNIFNTPGTGDPNAGNSLPLSIYMLFVVGWKSLERSNNLYEQIVYGRIPNDLTCHVEYMQSAPDNVTYTRHECLFVAVTPNTLPVFSVVSTDITESVLATAYDRAPVCSQSGCVFGNPVQSSFTQSAVYTIPKQVEAPQVGDVIIGVQSATGQTTLVDNPRGQNELFPVPAAQAGSILYLLQAVPANYNLSTAGSFPQTTLLDAWKTTHPFGYSAFDAAFGANLVTVRLINGRPVLLPGVPPQWMFAQRQDFNVHPTTDMKHHGQYIIYPNDWGAQVTLQVNLGPIVQTVIEGCLDLSIQFYTDGTADYTLSDSWPFNVQNVLRVRQVDTSVCPNVGDITYNLAPKQAVTKTVRPCGNQTFQLFEKVPGQPLVSCGPPIYVNSAVAFVNQVDRAVFAGINGSVIEDQAITTALDVAEQAAALLNTVLPFQAPGLFNPGATSYNPGFNQSDAIARLIAQLKAQGKKPVFSNITALDTIRPYLVIFNNASLSMDKLNKHIKSLEANLTAQQAVLDAGLLRLQIQQNVTAKASADLHVAIQNLIHALENQENNGLDDCPSCTDLPVLHQICCLLNNIGTWIGIVIMVIIFAFLGYGVYRLAMYISAKEKARKADEQINALQNATRLQQATTQNIMERQQLLPQMQPQPQMVMQQPQMMMQQPQLQFQPQPQAVITIPAPAATMAAAPAPVSGRSTLQYNFSQTADDEDEETDTQERFDADDEDSS